MKIDRDALLSAILTRNYKPEEFDFDRMTAPPVEYFLYPQEIQDIVYLANSVKYSGKINYKYQVIDQIMKNRGFVLLGRGTNRVVYRYLENNSICLKIAIDHVGSTDNPREYINQEYLKPYVAKIFSYEPSGTIAVAERVHPFNNREEFKEYARAICTIIQEFFIGKYVVNDIGSKYFMNWGVRFSTGMPVLLDYPYFYMLDINKARCMSLLEDGTICGGDIDYDDGFNFLRCEKCRRNYKAIELAKSELEDSGRKLITEGLTKMRAVVTIKRGDKIEKREINPESKKLEDNYNYVTKVSTKRVAQVIKDASNNELSINRIMTAASNIEKSENKVNVQTRRKKVAIVLNNENKAENNNNYETEGHFKPKHPGKVNPLKKNIEDPDQKLTETDFDLDLVKVSTTKAKNPIKVPEEVKEQVEEAAKVEEATVQVETEEVAEPVEEVAVTSAEDKESEVNEEGIHVEDESTEDVEEVEETPTDDTEISTEDSAEEIQKEIVEEDPADVEAEEVAEPEVEESKEEEEVTTPNLVDVIHEVIDQEIESVVEAVDEIPITATENLTPEEEEQLIMETAKQISEQKTAAKKKAASKKLDPDFYGTKKRKPAAKKSTKAEE